MARPTIAVDFLDLPPAGGSRRLSVQYRKALEALQDAPGEWARIATYPSRAGAWHVPGVLSQAFDGYEFRVRSCGDESFVWARFVGAEAVAA